MPLDRKQILEEAARIVSSDRNKTHGKPENSFKTIVNLWNAYLENRLIIIGNRTPLSEYDVGMMMALFKVARSQGNPLHADNYIDASGYLGCAGEIALKPQDLDWRDFPLGKQNS